MEKDQKNYQMEESTKENLKTIDSIEKEIRMERIYLQRYF